MRMLCLSAAVVILIIITEIIKGAKIKAAAEPCRFGYFKQKGSESDEMSKMWY